MKMNTFRYSFFILDNTYIKVIIMKEAKRRIRQEKLARLFYEMGMDLEVVSKISGIAAERIIKFSNKENKTIDY